MEAHPVMKSFSHHILQHGVINYELQTNDR